MDIDKLRILLKSKNIYKSENNKNFVCICPICGDHPVQHKKGHLWISKIENIPYVNCFIGAHSSTIPDFILKITDDKVLCKEIFPKDIKDVIKLNENIKKVKKNIEFKLPPIKLDDINKVSYFKNRINNLDIDITKVNNLVFDIKDFIELNNLTYLFNSQQKVDLDVLQSDFIGFLTKKHCTLICRNIYNKSYFQHIKLALQESQYNLLDYCSFPGNNPNSNLIVFSEGVYNILNENLLDTLKIKDDCYIYAAAHSFSYHSLLNSVCFNEGLYRVRLVILSDSDKQVYKYYKFIKQSKHLIDEIKIFYNKNKKDFGIHPLKPVEANLDMNKILKIKGYKL